MSTVRIVVAARDPIVREGLTRLLAAEPDLEIVGDAATPRDAVVAAVLTEPDLVVAGEPSGEIRDALAARGLGTGVLDAGSDARALLAAVRGGAADRPRLAPRQRDVVVALSRGLDTDGIARSTGLTKATVRSYLRAIYAKLGVRTREQAIAVCLREGLL